MDHTSFSTHEKQNYLDLYYIIFQNVFQSSYRIVPTDILIYEFVFVFDLVLEKITVCSAKFYSLWELCWLSQL
jgi:hypothetical protein